MSLQTAIARIRRNAAATAAAASTADKGAAAVPTTPKAPKALKVPEPVADPVVTQSQLDAFAAAVGIALACLADELGRAYPSANGARVRMVHAASAVALTPQESQRCGHRPEAKRRVLVDSFLRGLTEAQAMPHVIRLTSAKNDWDEDDEEAEDITAPPKPCRRVKESK